MKPEELARLRADDDASATDDLVDRFAVALKEKLRAAEAKYGYNDGWLRNDWQDDLAADLLVHVRKGDPRDVAAYCAFAWHHGWSVVDHRPDPRDEVLREARVAVASAAPIGGFCQAYYEALLANAWACLKDRKPFTVNADGAIALIQQAQRDRQALTKIDAALGEGV